MLLITAVVMGLVYHARGSYRVWAECHKPESIGHALLVDAVRASVPIIAFLVTSRIVHHGGQSLTLAFGLAAVSPPLIYAGVASVIGALGTFLTSSSTARMRTQSAPANVVVGTSIAGVKGQQGAVLGHTMPWTIVAALLTGLATVALVLLHQGRRPGQKTQIGDAGAAAVVRRIADHQSGHNWWQYAVWFIGLIRLMLGVYSRSQRATWITPATRSGTSAWSSTI